LSAIDASRASSVVYDASFARGGGASGARVLSTVRARARARRLPRGGVPDGERRCSSRDDVESHRARARFPSVP